MVYAAYGNVVVGAAALLLILIILVFEVKASVSDTGLKQSLIDIFSAVLAAVVVWFFLIVALRTNAPVDAVSSCSMLPALHRGDLVVLRGIDNASLFVSKYRVPVFNVSRSAFLSMQRNISKEFIAYFAYFNGNKSQVSYTIPANKSYQIGLYNTVCISQSIYLNSPGSIYRCAVPEQSQQNNLIRYSYAIGKLALPNATVSAIYTSDISVAGISAVENYSNPIIVYQTNSRDTFGGSIIHRLYAVLNVSGSYYFLTKGDNNQALDLQFGNYPANQSSVLGYVIATVPVVGYVKLLLSGQIVTPPGCNQQLQR